MGEVGKRQNSKMGQRDRGAGARGPLDLGWLMVSLAWPCLGQFLLCKELLGRFSLSSNPSNSLTCSVTCVSDFMSLSLSFFLCQVGCWCSLL